MVQAHRLREVGVFASWYNWTMLVAESQHVIALRMIRIASGGRAAEGEAQLMVSEKVNAATRAAGRLMAGGSPDSVVSAYRRTVQANARRLSGG